LILSKISWSSGSFDNSSAITNANINVGFVKVAVILFPSKIYNVSLNRRRSLNNLTANVNVPRIVRGEILYAGSPLIDDNWVLTIYHCFWVTNICRQILQFNMRKMPQEMFSWLSLKNFFPQGTKSNYAIFDQEFA
jgi:hypothetical protein